MLVSEFGPSALKVVRELLIHGNEHPRYGFQRALSGTRIDAQVKRIRRIDTTTKVWLYCLTAQKDNTTGMSGSPPLVPKGSRSSAVIFPWTCKRFASHHVS
jgi:hypothetical protein